MVNRQNKMGITRLEPDAFTRLICINSSQQESGKCTEVYTEQWRKCQCFQLNGLALRCCNIQPAGLRVCISTMQCAANIG